SNVVRTAAGAYASSTGTGAASRIRQRRILARRKARIDLASSGDREAVRGMGRSRGPRIAVGRPASNTGASGDGRSGIPIQGSPDGRKTRDGPDRVRKKKLIVAFHFQFSNQAGWKCDTCRQSGMDKARRCGWQKSTGEPPSRPVWVRRELVLFECPRSYITADSECLVEDFLVRRRVGGTRFCELSARQVEAFVILEKALVEELQNGQRSTEPTAHQLR